MSAETMMDILHQAMWVTIKVAMPILLIGLFIGVIISMIQAMTQIQEMTLTFVPKLIAIFFAIALLMPFMCTSLSTFSIDLFKRIAKPNP
jgi:flagellar biosynthesis protein FliQ